MQLEDKVALVTGGGSGIGRAIAQRFAAEGATVAVNDLHLDTAKETVDGFADGAAAGHPVAADVADSAQVRAMFDKIEATHGRLDILVNNAGIAWAPGEESEPEATMQSIAAIGDESWERMIGVHMGGTFYCTREAVRLMSARGGGSIVSISSIAALTGLGPIHYSAAKGGILGFTRSLARVVGSSNIRVNAICPGFIDTPMTEGIVDEMRELFVAGTPLGRFGTPEEIAAAALYLASDESSFTTGQWLSPNGGWFIG